MNVSTKRLKNSKSYSLKISKINFVPLKNSYKSTIKHKNYDLELALDLYISKEVYESGIFEIEEPEYQIRIFQDGGKKGVRLKLVFPLDEKEIDFVIDREGLFKIKFKASPADYNEILKRVEQREKEKKSQLSVPPIKIFYGGGVSPK